MVHKAALHIFQGKDVPATAPCFIIFSEVATPRLDYVCRFIFNRQLGARYEITTNRDHFKTSPHLKINYSKGPGTGFDISPAGLLAEKGVPASAPKVYSQDGLIYFFPEEGKGQSALHYDIFSAVFYCIARVEEWLPFEPDQHGRFDAKQSLFYQNKAHLRPVVDIWIGQLKTKLATHFQVAFPAPAFHIISTIDVDNLFAYRAKGWKRSLGGALRDLLRGDLRSVTNRVRVLSGKMKDPFDIYETVTDFCASLNIPLFYFFLFKTGTRYDRTVDPQHGAFSKVFEMLRFKKTPFGLHPSYDTVHNAELLQQQVRVMTAAGGQPVTLSRQHYLRFNIKETPSVLIKNGIRADFTMGFAAEPGFRAGTSYPFYYYDLEHDQVTDLLLVPFCAMDGAYTTYSDKPPEAAMTSLLALAEEVGRVGGFFTTVFHERTFYDHLYKGYGDLYKNLHIGLKRV